MGSTMLLSPETAPLSTLTVARLQLERSAPCCTLLTGGEELLLYPLIGAVAISDAIHSWGTFGGRRSVLEGKVQTMRFPAGEDHRIIVELVGGQTADLLVFSCPVEGARGGTAIAHREDVIFHQVGAHTHAREVREVPTPPGYVLHVGETYSDAGWSSWPSHAAPEELERYAEHEEVFWVCTTGYGLMRVDGRWNDGTLAQGVRVVHNNDVFVTPLGSHELVFSPGAWGLYVWCYRSFLTKTYNKWAHECVKTYVK